MLSWQIRDEVAWTLVDKLRVGKVRAEGVFKNPPILAEYAGIVLDAITAEVLKDVQGLEHGNT